MRCPCSWNAVLVPDTMCLSAIRCACSWYAVPVRDTLCLFMIRCACLWYAVPVADTLCLFPLRLTGFSLCLLLLQTEFWPWSRFIWRSRLARRDSRLARRDSTTTLDPRSLQLFWIAWWLLIDIWYFGLDGSVRFLKIWEKYQTAGHLVILKPWPAASHLDIEIKFVICGLESLRYRHPRAWKTLKCWHKQTKLTNKW